VSARQRRFGARPGLDALSGRELEIADRVALGSTNRQIADELYLSQKTVEGHLTSVFAKLGVSSRAEVAEAVGRARASH
jgi:DNA-binding NarL/FixJ family response regulator